MLFSHYSWNQQMQIHLAVLGVLNITGHALKFIHALFFLLIFLLTYSLSQLCQRATGGAYILYKGKSKMQGKHKSTHFRDREDNRVILHKNNVCVCAHTHAHAYTFRMYMKARVCECEQNPHFLN